MKLYHMAPKSGGKSVNFVLATDEEWNLELPTILAGTGSELNSMYWNGLVVGIDINILVKSLLCCQDAVGQASSVNDNITKTVSEVKQRHGIKETTATNGPKETVSNKTQGSLKRLEEGMRRVHNSIASINNDHVEDIELCTLLTTVVENLHAVLHFKHETFTTCSIPKTLE